ncbi:MAG: hypothetical protein PHU78_04245 [Heliobacteriaceae bacterium]|nr:hypothetical protein [Heliobacteriaceae bacterium]
MKKKSKLVAFIFSIVPGIAHFYAGFAQRALFFFVPFLGVLLAGMVLDSQFHYGFEPFVLFGLAVIWLVALIDVFSLIDSQGEDPAGNSGGGIAAWLNNRKTITVAFSVIPGAGHMYLGLLKQGAQLMTVFFLTLLLTNWLEFFGFILPVIWFYSLFDAYHLVEENGSFRSDRYSGFRWLEEHPNWVGWGLIFLGVLLIVQKIVAPFLVSYFDHRINSYIETGVVALILIAVGIKLLAGSRHQEKEEAKSCDNGG